MVLATRCLLQGGSYTRGSLFRSGLLSPKLTPALASSSQQQRHASSVDMEFYRSLPKAKYGGSHNVTLLPGLGIGPELTGYVKQLFRSAGVPVVFEEITIDPNAQDNADLDYAITSIRRNGAALKANIETRSLDPTILSRNVTLRNELDLYASVIRCKSFPGVKARQKDIDVVVIRQNTDGEYSMQEHETVKGVVECLKVMTDKNAERLARYAFAYAKRNGRKKITTIHKANIMKVSDGLFLDISRKVAKDFPEIEHNDMIIDNCCMQLVSNPHQFDVMLATNLYGSIIVNLLCGLTKGQGLISGQDFSDEYGVFETATRNTGTQIVGKNVANPIGIMNAAADLLRYLKLKQHSIRLREAIDKTVNEDKIHTPDLGGSATSTEVVSKITEYMLQKAN